MFISNVNSKDVNEEVTKKMYVIEESVVVHETHQHHIMARDEDEAIEIACESDPDTLIESHVIDIDYELIEEKEVQ